MKKFFDFDKYFENDSMWSDCGFFKIKIKRDNNFLKCVYLEYMEIIVNRIVLLFVMKVYVIMYMDYVLCKDG